MSRLRSAAIISVAAQGTMLFVAFTRVAVISRYLTPAEIGVFAVAGALMIMARIIRVFGVWEYIVAQKDLTDHTLRLCFTLVMTVSFLLMVLFSLGSGWLSRFLDAPDLVWLIPVMSTTFIILSLALIAQATMSREMRFGELAIIRVTAGVSDAVVTLVMVFLGFGILSLLAGFVVGAFISTALIVFYEPRKILFRPALSGIGKVIRFGWVAALGGALTNVTEFGPTLLLGRTMDAPSVAFFGRGQMLISIFRQGIEVTTGPVLQSWFAEKSRSEPGYVAQGYLMVTGLLAAITWPAYTFIFFNAPLLIPFLLGDQWDQSIPIAQALACGAIFSSFTVYGINLMAGRGNVGRRLRFSAIDQILRFTVLGICASFGLIVFAWGLAFSHLVSFALISVFLKIDSQLSIRALILSLRPSALLALPVALINLVAQKWIFLTDQLNLWQFSLVTLACVACWILGLILLDHPLLGHLREVLKNPRIASFFRFQK